MKIIKGILSAVLLASWGAGLLAAAPVAALPIRISLALPAQNIDFRDLDVRDENNRPVSASAEIVRRFEDILNANLNRLLIENLTPVHRAWMQMLSRDLDAFADWMGRAKAVVEHWLWTVTGRTARVIIPAQVGAKIAAPALKSAARAGLADQFSSLSSLLISSTRLIC